MSPMMMHYLNLKEKYPDTLIFYRLGDFYEMFFDDAKLVSRELQLTLTSRSCGMPEKAPMCGVPYHSVDTYIKKLMDKGYKVAICEQLTEPEKGNIVERDVIKVITAGTVTENNLLSDDKNNYLMSLYYEDSYVGASWTDITTGEFKHSLIEPPIAPKLNDLLSRINPAEIICNNEMQAVSLSLSTVKFGSVCPFSVYNDASYEYDNALQVLEAQFDAAGIKEIKSKKLCVNSAGALLDYVNTTQKRALAHISKPTTDDDKKFMIIDHVAAKTLELTENMQDGGKKGTLLWLMDKTCTNMGHRLLRKWISQPLYESVSINMRLDSVYELQNDIMRDIVHDILDEIYDLERLVGKISYGNITPKDFIALAKSLKQLPQLKNRLSSFKTKLLSDIDSRIKSFEDIEGLISSAIKPEPPINVRDGDVINDGFDEELDGYRKMSRNVADVIATLEAEEKEETGIKNLKIGYNSVAGYYIEVLKSNMHLVPYRYKRKQTLANCERYITDELRDLEIKITSARDDALNREQILYKALIEKSKEYMDDFLTAAQAVAELDCLVSFAKISRDGKYVRPIINDSLEHIKIKEGRHPVVEKLLKGESFVPNDTFLNNSTDKIMIITGPNMAGKSVYMRQTALITIMSHIGCFVPAKSAEIALTDRVFTRVGASDDVATGRSTFMVEMTEVSSILTSLTDNSLVLLDEIGRGTSTYDGLSIAWSIMEFLSKNSSAKVLFSTHYHELTELEGVLGGVKNYKLSLKEINGSIVFMRRLMRGSSNRSFGIEVASLAGLPNDVVTRAKELLKSLEFADIGRQAKMNSSQQLSFYNNDGSSEIVNILKDVDLDNITPRHALDILSDLKEKANKGE